MHGSRTRLALLHAPPAVTRVMMLTLAVVLVAACSAIAPDAADPGEGGEEAGPDLVDGVPSYMIKGDPDAPVTLYEWSDYQ